MFYSLRGKKYRLRHFPFLLLFLWALEAQDKILLLRLSDPENIRQRAAAVIHITLILFTACTTYVRNAGSLSLCNDIAIVLGTELGHTLIGVLPQFCGSIIIFAFEKMAVQWLVLELKWKDHSTNKTYICHTSIWMMLMFPRCVENTECFETAHEFLSSALLVSDCPNFANIELVEVVVCPQKHEDRLHFFHLQLFHFRCSFCCFS